MVFVTIEIWPGGDKSQRRTLGRMRIINDGTGTAAAGNYRVELSHSGAYVRTPGIWKRGIVRGFKRRLSPFHLVLKSLVSSLGYRAVSE